MANNVTKVNTIAIADIGKVNTQNDSDLVKLNVEEFTGIVYPSWAGSRAVIYGGAGYTASGHATDTTDYILYKTIASDGNAAEFDQAQNGRAGPKGSGSNGTRAVWGGGWTTVEGSGTLGVEQMDYVTVASTGSANDFGNLNIPTGYGGADGASNGTVAFFNGGRSASGYHDEMEYITISSTGTVTTVGDLEASQAYHSTSNGDSKYLIMGGHLGSGYPLASVSQHSFATSGNATDFGAASTWGLYSSAVASSTTRVVLAGTSYTPGSWTSSGDDIHYFSPASAATSVDDGYSLHLPMFWISGTSDGTTGEFFGGESTAANDYIQNRIQKITIASLTNAADAGDLAHPLTIAAGAHDYNVGGGLARMGAQTGT